MMVLLEKYYELLLDHMKHISNGGLIVNMVKNGLTLDYILKFLIIRFEDGRCSRRRNIMSRFSEIKDLCAHPNTIRIASTVFSCVVCCAVLPAIIFVLIVCKVYRILSRKWSQFRKGSKYTIDDSVFIDEGDGHPSFYAYLLALDGELQKDFVVESIQDYIGSCPNFRMRSILKSANGFAAWEEAKNFDVTDHVIERTKYDGFITEREVQHHISKICCAPLPRNQPPWGVHLIVGAQNDGRPCTWILFRGHRLLVETLEEPRLPKTFPKPWSLFEDTTPSFHSTSVIKKTFKNMLDTILRSLIVMMLSLFDLLLDGAILRYSQVAFSSSFSQLQAFYKHIHKCYTANDGSLYAILEEVYSSVQDIRIYIQNRTLVLLSHIKNATNTFILAIKSCGLEIYQIIKVIISIPLIIMEQWMILYGEKPYLFWSSARQEDEARNIVSWSDDLNLEGISCIAENTNTSTPSVMLGLITGGVKELILYSGSPIPPAIRCTISNAPSASTSFLSTEIPTGGYTHTKVVTRLNNSLSKMQNTSKLLATEFLLKIGLSFLPNFLLSYVSKKLTKWYPIDTSFIVGVDSTKVWDLDVLQCFSWKSPRNGSALSVCISCYQNKLSVGVIGNGWVVPHASLLSRYCSWSYSQLASECGVNINIRQPRIKTHSKKAAWKSRRSYSRVLDKMKNFQILVSSFQQSDLPRHTSA